jgi:hypothetical protein
MMRPFKLTAKFYILYALVFVLPASSVAESIQSYLSTLSPNNFIQHLASLGIIEAPTTVGILLGLFWLVDKWLWRIKWFAFLPVPTDINGRYEGHIVSSHSSDETYKVGLEVEQSLTDIKVCLYTKNSTSCSATATVGKNDYGNWVVSYIYQNKTSTVNHDEDMKDHLGVGTVEILDKGKKLKGVYFNNPRDRGRHGSIEVTRITRKLSRSFS